MLFFRLQTPLRIGPHFGDPQQIGVQPSLQGVFLLFCRQFLFPFCCIFRYFLLCIRYSALRFALYLVDFFVRIVFAFFAACCAQEISRFSPAYSPNVRITWVHSESDDPPATGLYPPIAGFFTNSAKMDASFTDPECSYPPQR